MRPAKLGVGLPCRQAKSPPAGLAHKKAGPSSPACLSETGQRLDSVDRVNIQVLKLLFENLAGLEFHDCAFGDDHFSRWFVGIATDP